jgi:hypothetical protein
MKYTGFQTISNKYSDSENEDRSRSDSDNENEIKINKPNRNKNHYISLYSIPKISSDVESTKKLENNEKEIITFKNLEENNGNNEKNIYNTLNEIKETLTQLTNSPSVNPKYTEIKNKGAKSIAFLEGYEMYLNGILIPIKKTMKLILMSLKVIISLIYVGLILDIFLEYGFRVKVPILYYSTVIMSSNIVEEINTHKNISFLEFNPSDIKWYTLADIPLLGLVATFLIISTILQLIPIFIPPLSRIYFNNLQRKFEYFKWIEHLTSGSIILLCVCFLCGIYEVLVLALMLTLHISTCLILWLLDARGSCYVTLTTKSLVSFLNESEEMSEEDNKLNKLEYGNVEKENDQENKNYHDNILSDSKYIYLVSFIISFLSSSIMWGVLYYSIIYSRIQTSNGPVNGLGIVSWHIFALYWITLLTGRLFYFLSFGFNRKGYKYYFKWLTYYHVEIITTIFIFLERLACTIIILLYLHFNYSNNPKLLELTSNT